MSHSQISRRALLRGAGASLALPFLESWRPGAAASAPAPPLRVLFMYAPNGKHMADWTPKEVGVLTDLPATLLPLREMKDQVTILSGLAQRNANPNGEGSGDHARAMATFLTGCRPRKTAGADLRVGISIDQVIAAAVGRRTRLPSLEIGCEGGRPVGTCDNGYSCAYQSNLAWRTASSPMPKETDPRIIFDRLFGVGAQLVQGAAFGAKGTATGQGDSDQLHFSVIDDTGAPQAMKRGDVLITLGELGGFMQADAFNNNDPRKS